MSRKTLAALVLVILLVPSLASAATFTGARSITRTDDSVGNEYLGGAQVTVTGPVTGDLSAVGGTVDVYAPVTGDVLAAGGSVQVAKPVMGDVRIVGGKITLNASTTGDVFATGGTVDISGHAGDMMVIGSTVSVSGGSSQDVTIYGANVDLSGTYDGNVTIVATNRFTLGENTHIAGILRYKAPQQISIPQSDTVAGGATYTGSYAYVPTSEQAHRYAILGTVVFFVVRALAGIIVAGLLVGLFPAFAIAVSNRALFRGTRRSILLGLLGFALFVATPLLAILLFISFIGVDIALILAAAYAGLVLLSYAFAGVLVGALLRRVLLYRISGVTEFSWKDAVLGTLVVHAIELVPKVGFAITCILAAIAGGAIAVSAYRHAFQSDYDFDTDDDYD